MRGGEGREATAESVPAAKSKIYDMV